NVKDITLASLVVGALLVIEGIVALIWGHDYFHLDFVQLQTFVMLMLIFTSQFRVLIVRERNYFWKSLPGKALMTSTLGATIAAALLGVYGVIVPALSLSAVLAVLVFSVIFTLLMDFPKHYAFKRFGVE
ncbi:MAG: plasma-membrane proton-efflux P-type ATPase, partial [Bacteroidetes bacterium]|nr:plasma-membrane proton-efflux P-type ATPase [Bacteroidota bacterium]